MTWLDLDATQALNQLPGWSSRDTVTGRWLSLVHFGDSDFFHPHNSRTNDLQLPLKFRVLQWIAAQPEGSALAIDKVVLLGHLRQWGYCFNPVVFFFCYDQSDRLIAIVSEITNTPWKERHAYLHVVGSQRPERMVFNFQKKFHVSPFMPMNLHYTWRFSVTQHSVGIHMKLFEAQPIAIPSDANNQPKLVFDTSMFLKKHQLTALTALQQPIIFPFQTMKVVFGIYWQALRLKLKGITVFDHPASNKE